MSVIDGETVITECTYQAGYIQTRVSLYQVMYIKVVGYDDQEVTTHKNPASLASYSKPADKEFSSMASVLDRDMKTKEIAVQMTKRTLRRNQHQAGGQVQPAEQRLPQPQS